MKKFKRPMPLSGSPDTKCERLKRDVNVLVTELEEELSRMDREIKKSKNDRETSEAVVVKGKGGLTAQEKQEIVQAVIDGLPKYGGEVEDV